MNIIEYKNVCMAYEGNTVIDNLNLSIGKGEFVTIIGSSGCGKTTVLKMVNGLILPTSGDVFVHEKKYQVCKSDGTPQKYRVCYTRKCVIPTYDS